MDALLATTVSDVGAYGVAIAAIGLATGALALLREQMKHTAESHATNHKLSGALDKVATSQDHLTNLIEGYLLAGGSKRGVS